jgi:hypothetical protein
MRRVQWAYVRNEGLEWVYMKGGWVSVERVYEEIGEGR